jgi:hypothetical protein
MGNTFNNNKLKHHDEESSLILHDSSNIVEQANIMPGLDNSNLFEGSVSPNLFPDTFLTSTTRQESEILRGSFIPSIPEDFERITSTPFTTTPYSSLNISHLPTPFIPVSKSVSALDQKVKSLRADSSDLVTKKEAHSVTSELIASDTSPWYGGSNLDKLANKVRKEYNSTKLTSEYHLNIISSKKTEIVDSVIVQSLNQDDKFLETRRSFINSLMSPDYQIGNQASRDLAYTYLVIARDYHRDLFHSLAQNFCSSVTPGITIAQAVSPLSFANSLTILYYGFGPISSTTLQMIFGVVCSLDVSTASEALIHSGINTILQSHDHAVQRATQGIDRSRAERVATEYYSFSLKKFFQPIFKHPFVTLTASSALLGVGYMFFEYNPTVKKSVISFLNSLANTSWGNLTLPSSTPNDTSTFSDNQIVKDKLAKLETGFNTIRKYVKAVLEAYYSESPEKPKS